MIIQRPLHEWPKSLKGFLFGFLLLLSSGVSIGIIYLYTTTSFTINGTIEHYNGSSFSSEEVINIPEKYAKPFSELLLTTHNHFLGFAYIFFFICGLFYFNSVIKGRLKSFLLIEPFISTWLTFASIWAIKYIDPGFAYLTFIAAIFTYGSFYLIVSLLLYEIAFKNSINKS